MKKNDALDLPSSAFARMSRASASASNCRWPNATRFWSRVARRAGCTRSSPRTVANRTRARLRNNPRGRRSHVPFQTITFDLVDLGTAAAPTAFGLRPASGCGDDGARRACGAAAPADYGGVESDRAAQREQ